MKSVAILYFFCLTATVAEAQGKRGGDIPWRYDHAAGLREAERSGKPVIIYITSDW